MIEVYNQNLNVTSNTPITFDGKNIETPSTTLATNSQTINIHRYGIYRVDVNAYGSSTIAGSIALQLMANGVPVARASSTATTSAGEPQAIGFSTYIKVNPSTPTNLASLTLQYTGTAGTLNLVNMSLSKVG